jgi:hypothetical protein
MAKGYRVSSHKTGLRSSGLSMDHHSKNTLRQPCKATQFIAMRATLSKLERQLGNALANNRVNKAKILRNLIAVKKHQLQEFAANYTLY